MIENKKFIISSSGNNSLIDITEKIKGFSQTCEAKDAVINVFTKGPCSSIITLNFKEGLGSDFLNYIDNLIPINWKQDNVSNEDSAYQHIRASILTRNMTFAITNKKLELSEGQRIVVVDFNTSPSDIEVVVSLIV